MSPSLDYDPIAFDPEPLPPLTDDERAALDALRALPPAQRRAVAAAAVAAILAQLDALIERSRQDAA